MKKFFLIIVLFAILFAVSVQAQTTASKMPADVRQVLKEAVRIEQADPPIDLVFLFEVKSDKDFQQYLETYRVPVNIRLGDVFIQYNYGRLDIFIGTLDERCTDVAECHNDGPFLVGTYGGDIAKACSQEITALLHGHRQSEFWPLLKAEVQKYVASGRKK